MSRTLQRLEKLEHQRHTRIQSMIDELSDDDRALAQIEFGFYAELQRLDGEPLDATAYQVATARAFEVLGDPSMPGNWPFLPLMTQHADVLCALYAQWREQAVA